MEGTEHLELVVDPECELGFATETGATFDCALDLAVADDAALLVDGAALERAVEGTVVALGGGVGHAKRGVGAAAIDGGLLAALHDVEDLGDHRFVQELLDGAHVGSIGFAVAEPRGGVLFGNGGQGASSVAWPCRPGMEKAASAAATQPSEQDGGCVRRQLREGAWMRQ